VKLLFDQNLSHRLVSILSDVYLDSQHVRNIGLNAATDTVVWEYARANGFIIVSKDSDFHQRSLVLGEPPKVIWIKLGNCSTKAVAKILHDHLKNVEDFESDTTATFLILS
jgi:predicted nuclease of predicted toxin-antitoxin system